jgi:two-component system phosphate regulon response regulator PhoB
VERLVFVVEDEADISRLIRHHLESAGFQVRTFATGNAVLQQAAREHPFLFLLDIMVPGRDGLELCRDIRSNPELAGTPIIFLTAKSGERERVAGLELGADDYVSKPFSPRELIARVRAVLRRFERPLPTRKLALGDVEIDSGEMSVVVRGAAVPMTATEFRLLEYMAARPGRVFTRDQLLDAVWRDTAFVTPRSVDVYIRRLREKVEKDPEQPIYLRTMRGVGYKFEAPKAIPGSD